MVQPLFLSRRAVAIRSARRLHLAVALALMMLAVPPMVAPAYGRR